MCAYCCRHPLSQLLLVSLMLLVYCCWLSGVDIPAFALSVLLPTPLHCWYCCKSRCTSGINDTSGKLATGIKDTGGQFATSINNIGGKVFHQFP